MCKSIELEKKKHVKSTKTQEDLRAIIQHMEGKLQQGRRNEAAFGLTFNDKKGGEESLEGVTKHYQKLEYDFDQLVQKHNESLAQINEIRIKVNASRAERVIYSGVFRNIEREIRLMEEEYMVSGCDYFRNCLSKEVSPKWRRRRLRDKTLGSKTKLEERTCK